MDYHNRNTMSTLIIPQEVYPAPQPYTRLPNVEFTVRGALGVRLVDALNPAFNGLDNPDLVPRMSQDAKKITLRLKVSTLSPCYFVFAGSYVIHNSGLAIQSGKRLCTYSITLTTSTQIRHGKLLKSSRKRSKHSGT